MVETTYAKLELEFEGHYFWLKNKICRSKRIFGIGEIRKFRQHNIQSADQKSFKIFKIKKNISTLLSSYFIALFYSFFYICECELRA